MHMMTVEPPILLFDGSFEGWLTAVFTVYEQRWQHIPYVAIHSEVDYVPSLWQSSLTIVTDEVKANRVSTKLEAVFGKGLRELLWGFLSEDPQVYRQLFNIVRYQLSDPTIDVWQDITQPDVMAVTKLVQMMGRERHRMQAFVRFEHTAQDVYFARIEPDFNVLPLLSSHFADRYADQNWAIFDVKRGYGLFYAKDDPSSSVQLIVDIDEDALYHPEKLHSEQEQQYQRLWQKYFTHVNIKERRNIKLHVQYLPRRYWKYLTEKQLIK